MILAAALALACDSDRTAIVLEAVNQTSDPLEEVVFQVSGPGLSGGAQEASASVSGPQARPFPLTLVLLGASDSDAGPYQVKIVGRRKGHAVAQAVRIDGASPVAFSPGKVLHYRFGLRPLASTDTMPPTETPPPMEPPPVMPPPVMPPPDAGPCAVVAQMCDEKNVCECPPGCACQFTCGTDHCMVRCHGGGTTCDIDVSGANKASIECAGAACLVRGAVRKGDVELKCPGGMPLECGNETQVCNRICP